MMATTVAYLGSLVPALGWTLAHFLWQGALVALVLKVLLATCRTARARHDLALAALVLMAALPVATFAWLQGDVRIVFVPPSFPGLKDGGLGWEAVAVGAWLAGVAVLVCMLIMVRNLYGVLTLVVTGAVVLGVSLRGSPDVQAAFAYAMTWFLLLGAVRPVHELRRQRRRGPGMNTDADQLAWLTSVPAPVWVLVFGLVTIGSLAAGGWLLLA